MDYTRKQLQGMINAIEEARYEVKSPLLKGQLGNISDLLDNLMIGVKEHA